MTWTAQAELLADAIRDPGSVAAAVTASAWNAGVHPEATHGLVGAAVALIGTDALSSLFAPVPPCPDDATLLRQAAEIEGDVAQLLHHSKQMADRCNEQRDKAISGWEQARAAVQRATAADDPGAAAAAEGAMHEAERYIADCDAALEILENGRLRLEHALKCLRQVPDDFAAHYEIPYGHIRESGPLPHDGEFLTGGISWEAA